MVEVTIFNNDEDYIEIKLPCDLTELREALKRIKIENIQEIYIVEVNTKQIEGEDYYYVDNNVFQLNRDLEQIKHLSSLEQQKAILIITAFRQCTKNYDEDIDCLNIIKDFELYLNISDADELGKVAIKNNWLGKDYFVSEKMYSYIDFHSFAVANSISSLGGFSSNGFLTSREFNRSKTYKAYTKQEAKEFSELASKSIILSTRKNNIYDWTKRVSTQNEAKKIEIALYSALLAIMPLLKEDNKANRFEIDRVIELVKLTVGINLQSTFDSIENSEEIDSFGCLNAPIDEFLNERIMNFK